MNLSGIISNREYEHRVFYDLVREWEDGLSEFFNVPIYSSTSPSYIYEKLTKKWNRRLLRYFPFTRCLFIPSGYKILFEMQPNLPPPQKYEEFGIRYDAKQIIPWIIDCIFTKDDLRYFNDTYRIYPLVLISSAKSFKILKEGNWCPDVNIAHCALTINDKYNLNTLMSKKYDVVLVGRQENILLDYLEKYRYSHPNLSVVSRQMIQDKFQYIDNKGVCLGTRSERSEYIDLIKSGKIAFYSTPHSHPQYELTQDFVTPRFLEYIACGCHIIAKYPMNVDVEYWELQSIAPSINSYSQFETAMDYMLRNKIDEEKYTTYLAKHYTSARAIQLQELIAHI